MCALFLLSLPNDPAGFIGIDTGGKVATLESIDQSGKLDLDVGYWAADVDPEGSIHPLWFTSQFEERWVQVTTVPMVVVAAPLYSLGGYRLALVLPMLGAVAAAFGASALARRLGSRHEQMAFWIVGLASPVTIYALDFWEHTLGLAAMTWGVVAALGVRAEPNRWSRAVLFGLAFGFAATMRTEALVYALVTGIVMLWPSLRQARVGELIRNGACAVGAAVSVMAANGLLEVALLGETLRSGRATGAATSGGGNADELTERVEEAGLTLFGARASFTTTAYLTGAVIVGLLIAAVVMARRNPATAKRYGLLAALMQAIRVLGGLGFVPGALVAGPLASVGLGAAVAEPEHRRGNAASLLVIALASLPLVWAFQYTGGMVAQWAGRYILLTGLLLSVIGVHCLSTADRWARVGGIALTVAVTFSGLSWMWIRTNGVADTLRALDDPATPVLVSDIGHLWREGGAFWPGTTRLTVVDEEDRAKLAEVLEVKEIERFSWVQRSYSEVPAIAGFDIVDRRYVDYLLGTELAVTTMQASG